MRILPIAMMGAGGLLVYTGFTGRPLLAEARNLLHGGKPGAVAAGNALSPEDSGPVQDLPVSSIDGNYSSSQLQSLWQANGGSPATAAIAACIAMHESSGSPTVTSSNPDGGTNVGLWQLDTRGVGSGHSVSELQNPNTNASVAIHGSGNGTNWADWATASDCGA
jgi:hypothetical protein